QLLKMLATAGWLLSSCLTLVISTGERWDTKEQGNVFINNDTTTTLGRPRDCQDLIHQDNTYEGHYVVYPDTNAPNRASMMSCSIRDGMKPLPSGTDIEPARNCLDLLKDGMTTSGVNIIYPYLDHPADPVLVLCDQDTLGGGWTVIQHRYDGSEDFFRSWDEYIIGFGDVAEEHYLGNDKISAITGQVINELMVDLEAFDDGTAYAHYQMFHLDARYDYQLEVFSYIDGTAGDSLAYHNGQPFSTFDSDHDASFGNCAETYHGAWWYNGCQISNLNGRYYSSDNYTSNGYGIRWFTFQAYDSLKTTKMMIRPYAFTATDALTGGLNDTETDGVAS
ncbi:unnamed protein product, partial [Meganyctiphanes norvegica]